jgi:hypothetical protein
MAKRSTLRTVGLIAGVGCLTMIVVVVGGIVITVMMADRQSVGEVKRVQGRETMDERR